VSPVAGAAATDVGGIVVGALLLAMCGVLVSSLPKWWSGRDSTFRADVAPGWWPLDLALWRGLVRSLLSVTAFISFMAIGVLVASFLPESIENRLPWLGAFFFIGFTVLFIVDLSVMFYNSPKFLVPPHLRKGDSVREERRKDWGKQ